MVHIGHIHISILPANLMPQRMLGFLHMRAAPSLNVLALLASIILLAPGVALAGSQSFFSPGAYTFVVPAFTSSLTAEVWGAGGGAATAQRGNYAGTAGTYSSFNGSVIGHGGGGGHTNIYGGGVGAGGSASGGDKNIVGGSGTAGSYGMGGNGGTSQSGGAGGAGTHQSCVGGCGVGSPGGVPGGGGGGTGWAGSWGSGGGAGGYAVKTYYPSTFPPGTAVSIVVRSGGVGGGFNSTTGGPGAPGGVKVTWDEVSATAPPPPEVLACTITFDKNPIKPGQSTAISWRSTKATLFYINGIGYVSGTGSARVSPGSTSDFGGYVSDASGATVSCPATLTVSNSCPPGQVLVNGRCTQQCPPGFTYRNGECTFIGCPLGYVRQDDKCVFSACPAGYVKDGERCVRANQCTTPPKCVGDELVNSCNGDTIATCDYGCAGGVCNPVPAPSGVINAAPKLLHVGYTSTISWSATNVRACTVTGTNGDAWTGNSSSGKTSKPIQMQTTYYLHCDGYAGSSPASIDKQVSINIIPRFNEQ